MIRIYGSIGFQRCMESESGFTVVGAEILLFRRLQTRDKIRKE